MKNFLLKHKSKHSCESAIFSNLTSKVVYSLSLTTSVLNGGSHILLANMLSPVPRFPYVLVNRSLLCNCHLESGLTYLLESLGLCSVSEKFTMNFTANSAFNHYLSLFGLFKSEAVNNQHPDGPLAVYNLEEEM